MTARDVIEDKLPQIAELCRRFGVRKLWLFGSAADGRFDPDTSDVDLAVEFGPPPGMGLAAQYFDFCEELRTLFQREIDLVERSAVRNPIMLRAIERQEKLIYAA